MYDPWFKATLGLRDGPHALSFDVPHDVFSTQTVDEGTRLLLEHLPSSRPRRILDLGCGYGALGLPVAARHPEASVEMVDRDLLAVEWADRNAAANGLGNARAHGSLGFRDLDPAGGGAAGYDWILCNVPARIGRAFIAHLFEQGRARLAPGGEVRVVVIRDLGPVLEGLESASAAGGGDKSIWPTRVADGPRHSIFALPAAAAAGATAAAASAGAMTAPEDSLALYGRDEVHVGPLALLRPHDLGGDDPRRLREGLPVLLDVLPRAAPKTALCWRSGYGALPLTMRARWPDAPVVAVERDLLATAFTALNAERCGLGGERFDLRAEAHFPRALKPGERFAFAAGEISPSAGEQVAEAELAALAGALAPGGQALLLVLEKLERQWLLPIVQRRRLRLNRVIAREGYSVVRLAA